MPRSWRVEFYNRRLGTIAPCTVDAPSPEDAVVLGRRAVLAEHPPTAGRKRRGLFAQAERAAGHDDSGWVLYRIRGGRAPGVDTPPERHQTAGG
jgi:hypothetical protein